MAEGGPKKLLSGLVGLIVVVGILNLLSYLLDWGWWFY